MWDKSIHTLFPVPFPPSCRSLSREGSTRCWTWSTQTRQHLRQWWAFQLQTDWQHCSLSYSFHNLYSASQYYFHPSQEQIAQDDCDHSQPARITWARMVIQNSTRTRHATLVGEGTRRGLIHCSPSPSLFSCIVSSAVCGHSVATYLTGCLPWSRAEAPQKRVQKMDLKRCAGKVTPLQRADESCWTRPEKLRLHRGCTVKKWDAVTSSKKTFSLHTWD